MKDKNNKNKTTPPKATDCIPPFYLVDGEMAIASTDGYNGWCYEAGNPPRRISLTTAENDGVVVDRKEFLRVAAGATSA